MELLGTGKMIQVAIDSHRDTPMADLDFSLEFYVHPNRRKLVSKADMIRIDKAEGFSLFFALLDTRTLDVGELMCNIRIADPEPRWAGDLRPVLLKRSTGFGIGGAYSNPCHSIQKEWEEGYKVDFNSVYTLPKPEVAYIFYGYLVNQLTSYADITADMLVSPDNHILSVSASGMSKTSCGVMAEGDKVVVLIPVDTDYTATKDNGFGGQMPFSTQIMGSNGDHIVTIDGVQYRAYGEMMTTEGEMFIYVNCKDMADNTIIIGGATQSSTISYTDLAAMKSDINGKVDKEEGKGLSSNDFTTAEKTKLASIVEGATSVSAAYMEDTQTLVLNIVAAG